MTMDIEDYATSFRPDIIDAVSGWCQGATFAKILTLTDIFEVSASMLGTPYRLWQCIAGSSGCNPYSQGAGVCRHGRGGGHGILVHAVCHASSDLSTTA